MKRLRNLKHEFVEFIPESRRNGVIYVSLKYATAVHNCCCGCGAKVVTPLSPTDWKVTFDGETISLRPSIGNWSFKCQSHYWIVNDKVEWAAKWTKEEIERARERDRLNKQEYYGKKRRDSTYSS